jgi:hypothetical protein
VVAEIAAAPEELRACWQQHGGLTVVELSPLGDGYVRCVLEGAGGQDLREEVFRTVRERGWTLRELTQRRQSLEDVFLRVTRREPEPEEW